MVDRWSPQFFPFIKSTIQTCQIKSTQIHQLGWWQCVSVKDRDRYWGVDTRIMFFIDSTSESSLSHTWSWNDIAKSFFGSFRHDKEVTNQANPGQTWIITLTKPTEVAQSRAVGTMGGRRATFSMAHACDLHDPSPCRNMQTLLTFLVFVPRLNRSSWDFFSTFDEGEQCFNGIHSWS